MKNPPFVAYLVVCGLSLATPLAGAGDNQFIDDSWLNKGDSRGSSGSARTALPSARAPSLTPVLRASGSAATPAPGDTIPAVQGLPPDPGDGATYRISPSDVLKIQVFQVEELSSEERVSEEGQIVMPLIGPVKVAGLTPKEAEAQIAAILGRDYLQDPQVDIYVKESSTQQVTVMGSVKKPGVFPIAGRTTLLQAIALAEGADPLAKEGEVIVFRSGPSGDVVAYVVDLTAIKKGKSRDPVLVGDDRVVVPQSGTAVFLKGLTDSLRGFVHVPLY